MLNYPASRKEDIVVQELGDEVLVYDLKENKAFCLNPTSALVWQLCDGNKSATEIARLASADLKKSVDEKLVWLALDQLKKENLLSSETKIEPLFNGLSRREAIRKVGIASMVALPAISFLVAPTAAHAQSGGAAEGELSALGGPCVNPGDCRQGASGNEVQCTNDGARCGQTETKCCTCADGTTTCLDPFPIP